MYFVCGLHWYIPQIGTNKSSTHNSNRFLKKKNGFHLTNMKAKTIQQQYAKNIYQVFSILMYIASIILVIILTIHYNLFCNRLSITVMSPIPAASSPQPSGWPGRPPRPSPWPRRTGWRPWSGSCWCGPGSLVGGWLGWKEVAWIETLWVLGQRILRHVYVIIFSYNLEHHQKHL